ncbi:MAG TPA: GAF domain-containing sensor histidine kinase [Armatimonadota bacterium]|jgi:signal transduction histidine kinase
MDSQAENAQLRTEISQLTRQLAAVQQIAAELSSVTRVEDITREALQSCLEIAGAEAGSLVLYDPKQEALVYREVIGEKAAEIRGMAISPDRGLAGKVFHSGESLISEDVSKEQSHLREIDERTGYVTHNMVTAPLRSVTGDPLGVLQVLNKREGAFDANDVRLIEIMASEVAVAIESARLAEEARLATVVRFLGDLSHDVKNMISPVKTGSETLLMFAEEAFAGMDEAVAAGGPDCPERIVAAFSTLRELLPELVEMFLEGSDAVQQRMAEIANAIKGMVSEPTFEEAEVPEIAERVLNLLRPQAEKQKITLSAETVGEVPSATVDKKQIYNLIYNLVFNAIDACPAGCAVTFRTLAGPLGSWPEGDYLTLECEDTGPGIPPEVKAKLFTENAVSTKPMGTGLGTKIVANVVRAHGGEISLESELGHGTTIRAKIPLHQPPK